MTNTFTLLTLPEKVIQLQPLRVILRRDENGELKGQTENSFSLSYESNRVLIYWTSNNASSILGTHKVDAIDWANKSSSEGDLIFDPLSDDCPIEIDWKRWVEATTKYDKRNAHFKLKTQEK